MSDRRRGRNTTTLAAQKVLKTDGITNKQYIFIPAFTTTIELTISFWYKKINLSAVNSFAFMYGSLPISNFNFYNSSTSNFSFTLWGRFSFGLPIAAMVNNSESWNHFAAVVTTNSVKIYKNFILFQTEAIADNNVVLTFNSNFFIGAMPFNMYSSGEFARISWVKKAITTFPTSPLDDDYYSDLTDYQFLIEGNIDRVGATVTAVNSLTFPDIIYP
jgi:hypothetical protein